MSDAPVIVAFDLATMTGLCWGRVGSKHPNLATWDMRDIGVRPARLLWFFNLCTEFFHECEQDGGIDQVWYEAPMKVAVMNKIGASEEVIAMLRGLVAVLELTAVRSGLMPNQIHSFEVQDARHHLTGSRTFGKSKSGRNLGKEEVMRVAKMLGVECANHNEGDAFAGWSYACGLANPRIAHLVTPLFARV